MFHKITLEFGEWMKSQAEELGITTLICCGDVFHNRKTIFNPTIKAATDFFDNLKDFDIRMITGNHDCYYLENSSVNSISMFRSWENITVYDSPFYDSIDGKRVGFIPWGTTIEEIEKCDIMFGHFDIVGFQMGAKFCDHGMDPEELIKRSPLVFSGHFHKPQVNVYKKGKIVYLGSPFQHDWGEAGQSKYIYDLDFSTSSYNLIENNISPKHIEVREEKDISLMEGNIVKIMSDSLDSELVKKASGLETLKSEVVIDKEKIISVNAESVEEFKAVDILESTKDFISNIEGTDEDMQSKIFKKFKDIYEKTGA